MTTINPTAINHPSIFTRQQAAAAHITQEQITENNENAPDTALTSYDAYETETASPAPTLRSVKTPEKHVSPEVEAFVKNTTPSFTTPAQETAKIIANEMRKKWSVSVNPDTTYITTLNYNIDHPKPQNGKVLNQTTLTQAALANTREKNEEDQSPTAQQIASRSLEKAVDRFSFLPVFSELSLAKAIDHAVNPHTTYEYIFRGADPSTLQKYDSTSRLPVSPQQFRDLVWDTELKAPYKAYLDKFWPANEAKYPQLSKIAFAQAAFTQAQESSLSEQDAALAMRAAGVSSARPWLQMTPNDLTAPYAKDPNLEVGLLSINGDQSTDLMYVTDLKSQTNAEGKQINTTLLHIPGNSSPIHRFDSPQQMKTWLAEQATDPNKRAAILTHFTRNDQDDKFLSDGVKQSLTGLAAWVDAHKPDASAFSKINGWDPQGYITSEPVNGNPFDTIAQRQKARSYADADHDITTDGDVTKAAVVKGAEMAGAAALMMTPLAFVVPEVAVALDAVYVAAGITEAAVGIDDIARGKSGGADRLVFGALNAAPGLLHGASKGVGQLARPAQIAVAEEIELNTFRDGQIERPVATRTAPGISADSAVHSPVAETVSRDGKLVTLSGNMDHIQKIDDKLYTFIDINKKDTAQRLNIIVHGNGQHVYFDKQLQTPEGLLNTLRINNINPSEFDNIRLLSCHSGEQGENSFAAKFQRLVGKPVKGYVGTVTAKLTPENITDIYQTAHKSIDDPVKADIAIRDFFADHAEFKAEKTNPHNPFVNPLRWWRFTYEPVHFPLKITVPKA